MIPAPLRRTLVLTSLAGLMLCLLMAWWKLGNPSGIAGCGAGSPCQNLLASRWSQVLHLPVSLPAALVYLATLAALRRPRRDLLVFLAACLLAAAIWFFALQAFVARAFCPWCTAAHACGLVTACGLLTAARRLPPQATAPAWILGTGAVVALAVAQALGPAPAGFRVENVAATPASPTTLIPGGTVRPANLPVPRLGHAGAKHQLIFYFDYTCPACRTTQDHLDALLAAHPGQIEILVVPVPLDPRFNPYLPTGVASRADAGDLARLAMAAWLAAPRSFPAVHATLFARSNDLTTSRLETGQILGETLLAAALERAEIDRALLANAGDYRVLANRVTALPKLVINGKRIVHGTPPSRELFLSSLRRELGL